MTRLAMIYLDNRIQKEHLNIKLIAVIHDELLTEFYPSNTCKTGIMMAGKDQKYQALKAQEGALKKANDKDSLKIIEAEIKAYTAELEDNCKSNCSEQCAHYFEKVVGDCMVEAGDYVLQGRVKSGYSIATKTFWAH